MTSFVLFTESAKPQTLDEGETGFIGPGALLAVLPMPGDPNPPQGPAIQMNGGARNATVLGTVVGTIGIGGVNAEDARIVVGDQGDVTGIGTAINLGAGAEIVNDGTIASQTGLALRLHDGDNHIVNAGMIAGPVVIRPGNSVGSTPVNHLENAPGGIIAADGAAAAIRVAPALATSEVVVNDGAIYGDLNLHAMRDMVVNRGIIASDVRLGGGDDVYRGGGTVNGKVLGGSGNDLLKGGADDDRFDGGRGADTLYGHDGDDNLAGGGGRDWLVAGAGNDFLYGGGGGDLMTGGDGNDRFFFKSLDDFATAGHGRDLITDFVPGEDVIDLSAINPPTQIPTAFTFVGTHDFSGTPSNISPLPPGPFELRYEIKGNKTVVGGDVDGDGTPDFKLWLVGRMDLHASDFLL